MKGVHSRVLFFFRFFFGFTPENIAQKRLFVIKQKYNLGGRCTSHKLLDVSFIFFQNLMNVSQIRVRTATAWTT